MNIGEIINKALVDIAIEDPRSIFMAQGINDPAPVFGTLNNLCDHIPESRLVEMPVAENGGIGVAVGAAMSGLRPIVSVHRVEFLLLALEQLFNNAAKANFLSGGSYSAPILIRGVIGRGWGQGPSHSQGFEGVFASIPGLKVVCPSIPETAYDLLRRSYADDAPVICLEHRWSHYSTGEIKKAKNPNASIQPIQLSKGDRMTIVSYGYLALECILVVNEFRKIGINIDLIDLQIIRPLNLELVFDSVKKTGHLLVVDQGYKFLGLGAEIVSQVVENNMSDLQKPPARLGLPSLPSPSAISLAKDYYCTSIDIAKAAHAMLDLSDECAIVLGKIETIRNATPLDVPNQYFKGPF